MKPRMLSGEKSQATSSSSSQHGLVLAHKPTVQSYQAANGSFL